MRIKVFIILLILVGHLAYAANNNPSIEVNGDTEIVTINGKDYAIPIKRTILFQLFGKPDIKESKVNTIYTWHELGKAKGGRATLMS